MQCQYPYADTARTDAQTHRYPDAHRPHPNPMTTPDDTTDTTDTTTRTPTDQTSTATRDGQTSGTDDAAGRPNATSPQIPGRIPATEEAGAPLVPHTRPTTRPAIDPTPTGGATRRPSPPPTDGERDAPLVPDLRPTRRPRADGGAR